MSDLERSLVTRPLEWIPEPIVIVAYLLACLFAILAGAVLVWWAWVWICTALVEVLPWP